MTAIENIITKKCKHLNECSNNMVNSPEFNKLKQLVKIYFKANEIKEISVNDFNKLFSLNKTLSLQLLKDINKDLF